MMNSLQEVVEYLQTHDDFIIVGHENPDPDSLGSMLGLHFGLKKLGKKSRIVSADPVPDHLSWPGLELIEYIPGEFVADDSVVVVVDCEPHRTGSINEGVMAAKRLVNIDHHQRERGLGDVVYVNSSESACCVIIYRILLELDVLFDREIATAIYGGILGDTGGFRHANTNGEVLEISAKLLEYGLEPARMAREIFSSQSFEFLRFLGFSLQKLQTRYDGQLVWLAISNEEFAQFAVEPENTGHLVSYARMLETAEIALVLREVEPGVVRVALRANYADVGSLARHFGGGGHKLASGATLEGNFAEITDLVVQTTEDYLRTGEINARNN